MQYYVPMGTIEKRLERMRENPRDWRIEALIALASKQGIEVRNHGGSHYVFSFPGIEMALSIPSRRPIKPVYVKQFIELIDLIKRNNP
jgi:hypothetical protein